jgi:putative transposase
MRNSLAFVSWSDRKGVAAVLKTIYQSVNVTESKMELYAFALQWDKKYLAFFDYPDEIRKVVNTTKTIEYSNSVIRKSTFRRRLFLAIKRPKAVYLTIEQAVKKLTMPIQNWKPALNQFMIPYEERLVQMF